MGPGYSCVLGNGALQESPMGLRELSHLSPREGAGLEAILAGWGATSPGRSPQGQAWPRMGKSINPKRVLFSVLCK